MHGIRSNKTFPIAIRLLPLQRVKEIAISKVSEHQPVNGYLYRSRDVKGQQSKTSPPLSPPLVLLLHPVPAGWKVALDEAELKPTELFPLPVFFPLWLLPWLEDFLPFTSDRTTSELSLLPSWWLVEPWQQQTQRSLPRARCGHSRGSFHQFPLKRSNCPPCPQSDGQVMLLRREKQHFPLLLLGGTRLYIPRDYAHPI